MRFHVLVLCVCVVGIVECSQVAVLSSLRNKWINMYFNNGDVDGNSTRVDLQITEIGQFREQDEIDLNTAIKSVKNLPLLRSVHINVSTGLTEMPLFQNVPQLETINITDNNITKLKKNSLSHLAVTEIDLVANSIQQVEEESFGTSVSELYLDCNQLQQVSARWFRDPAKLRVLTLNYNYVTHLEANFLEKFTILETLEIKRNLIDTIGVGALSCPAKLEAFILNGNLIKELLPSAFTNGKNQMEFFDISYNRMTYLTSEVLDKLEVERVSIYGNPWQCPCLPIIEEWIRRTNVVSEAAAPDVPSCVFALAFPEVCVDAYEPELYKYMKRQTNFSEPAWGCD